jgi:hypothetical protein
MNKTTPSILALILAALGALLAGLVIGALAGLLSNIVYIVFLFPLGMGFSGALFVEKTITGAKVRAAAQGMLLGGLMAAAIYAAFQAANYSFFRWQASSAMRQTILAETGKSESELASVLVDYALQEETGFSGFPGYILYKDKQGVTVGRMFGSGFNLGPFFTWAFWLLEFVIIGWMTVGVGRQATRKPFCERCKRWYGQEGHLGGVSAALGDRLTQLLEQKEFARAAELLEADAQVPSLEVYAQGCEGCHSSDSLLALKQVSIGRNGKLSFKPVSQMSIRPHEIAELLRQLKPGAAWAPGAEPEAVLAGPRS